MLKVLTSAQMALADKKTIEDGISAEDLMFRAAQEIYKAYDFKDKKVLILTGTGNNGGDGYALATIFQKNNIDFKILQVLPNKSETAKVFLNKLDHKNIFTSEIIDVDVIIDCIFGNGQKRELSKDIKVLIKAVNEKNAFKIAVDIPSGLATDSGYILGECFKADMTLAIAYLRPGHILNQAKNYVGEIKILDIGIVSNYDVMYLADESILRDVFIKRDEVSTKKDYGHTVIMGGSRNFYGAPQLAFRATESLAVGAGCVSVALPSGLCKKIAPHILDQSLIPIMSVFGNMVFRKSDIKKVIKIATSIAFGMGIGKSSSVDKILKYLIENFEGYLLIDADGIYSYARIKNKIKKVKSKLIFTPHIKEASVLTGIAIDEILKNPIDVIMAFAKDTRSCVLLKGSASIISDGDEVYFVNNGSVSQAKGGNGDCLSGATVGILAYLDKPLLALIAATYLLAKVSKNIAKIKSEYGVLASDLAIGIKKLLNSKEK